MPKKKTARVADVQLDMIKTGPTLEPNSVDPYLPPGAGRRQPSAALLVPGLRAAVNAWRLDGYPGLSDTTRRLFEFWFEEDHPLRGGGRFRYYFAQREAIETLVYCYEVAAARSFAGLLQRDKENIKRSYGDDGQLEAYRSVAWPPDVPPLPYDPMADLFPHYVVKLATGGGKTKIMALAVVWSYFHKLYEPNSPLATNFLVIAPNLIVFERLATDFRSGAIFIKDPLLPPEFRPDFDLQVVLQEEAAPPSARGTLFLSNVQRLYEEKPREPENPVQALLPPPVRKGAALGRENDLLARIAACDDLIVIDDEAHHVHDEKLAWNRAIAGLHQRLSERGLALTAQLDFSATPKHNDGALFEQIVSDYPLADAIASGIVKQPLLVELPEAIEVRSSERASVRYKQWIDAGVARLKDYEAVHLPAGKQPVLFIMAAETKDADDVAAYVASLDGFAGRVLTIHTNTRGEISEAASSKNREELERLREASRAIDADNNPYRVVVSVLMLREGWDVRNVTVVVGLRAYSAASDILPEQTIGRGLRLMYGGSADNPEQLDILGTEKFEEFVKGLRQTDNVEFKQRAVTDPISGRAILVQPSKVGAYEIWIPQLTNLLQRSQEAIDAIDFATLTPRFAPVADDALPSERQEAIRRDMLTRRVEETLELELPLPSGATGIIWFYTRGVLRRVKMPTTLFERLAGPVKQFLGEIAFGRAVDLDDIHIWWRLLQDDAYEQVVGAFARAINTAARIEVPVDLKEEQARPVSQTAAFVWGKQVYAGEKTVFNLVPVDSQLEADLAAFLDAAPDVAAYAKNTNKVGLTIDYQSYKGHFRLYQPDFVVRLDDGGHWLVETKGLEDLEVARKDARARLWCEDATELTASTERPQRWSYVKVLEETFRSHHGKRFLDLAAHARAASL